MRRRRRQRAKGVPARPRGTIEAVAEGILDERAGNLDLAPISAQQNQSRIDSIVACGLSTL